MRSVFLYFCFFVSTAASAVDISRIDLNDLHGKTVAYYFGSFDPFHNGHQEVTQRLLDYVDYVLIVPSGVADKRKPHRTDPRLRREMLGELFNDHPKILTSQLNPRDIQVMLRPHEDQITFYGVQGTEILDEFERASENALEIYLQGKDIPPEKADTALAAMMAVKAEGLFVPLRDPDSPWKEAQLFHGFPLIPVPLSPHCGKNSSTGVRENVKLGQSFHGMIPPLIASYIKKNSLYAD